MSEMTGQQIYDNFKQGRGTDQLRMLADEIAQLQGTYKERADSMKAIRDRMSEAWQGDASAHARSGINPVMAALEDSAGYMDRTTHSMAQQTTDWHQADAAVVPVPDKPDKPSGWSVGLKAAMPIVGPGMAKGEGDTSRDGCAAHNKAAANNVRTMNADDGSTKANSNFPTDYGSLYSFGSEISVNEPDMPDGGGGGSTGWSPGPGGVGLGAGAGTPYGLQGIAAADTAGGGGRPEGGEPAAG